MRCIDGRLFLWVPILIYIIYIIIPFISNHLNTLSPEERERFIEVTKIIVLSVIMIWSLVCLTFFFEFGDKDFLIGSPLIVPVILWIVISKINNFFKKHLTINLK